MQNITVFLCLSYVFVSSMLEFGWSDIAAALVSVFGEQNNSHHTSNLL